MTIYYFGGIIRIKKGVINMLTLTKVPNEIYYTACEYDGIDIKIEQLELAKEIWDDNNSYKIMVLKKRYMII